MISVTKNGVSLQAGLALRHIYDGLGLRHFCLNGSFSFIDETLLIGYSPAMENLDDHDNEWEELCLQCGRCCFEKYENEDGTIFFTATPCRYLDVVTRHCKVYDRRFEINPDCIGLTPDLVRSLNWLHDSCAYRRALGLKRRQGKPGTQCEDIKKHE